MKAQQEAGLWSRDNLSGLSVRSWAMQDIESGEIWRGWKFHSDAVGRAELDAQVRCMNERMKNLPITCDQSTHSGYKVPCHASEVKFISKRIKHLLFINLLSPLEGLNCSRPALPRYSNRSPSASGWVEPLPCRGDWDAYTILPNMISIYLFTWTLR